MHWRTDSPSLTTKTMKTMTLNEDDLQQLKFNYAEKIVDDMDLKTLIVLAIESIEHNMKDWDEDDVKSEILSLYDEETLTDLLP